MAAQITPDDPEVQYNLGAVLEACEQLEEAVKAYERAHKGGIERAQENLRVSLDWEGKRIHTRPAALPFPERPRKDPLSQTRAKARGGRRDGEEGQAGIVEGRPLVQ